MNDHLNIRQLTGIEFLKAVIDGVLPEPPMVALINADIIEAERGRVVFTCTPGAQHFNPLGTVHGGLVCTLLDTVAGCATHTLLERGIGYTSIEIKVNFLRPVTLDSGVLTATGSVTKAGRRVVFTDAVVIDASGDALATATSSLLVLGEPGESAKSK